MKHNIQEILNEIYDIDPTLKGREEELKKALKKMLKFSPDVKIDKDFKEDLRQRLYVEAKYGSRSKFDLKNFVQVLTSFAVGGALTGLTVIFIFNGNNLDTNQKVEIDPDSPESIMMGAMDMVKNNAPEDSQMFRSTGSEKIAEDDSTIKNNDDYMFMKGEGNETKQDSVLDGDEIDNFMFQALEQTEKMQDDLKDFEDREKVEVQEFAPGEEPLVIEEGDIPELEQRDTSGSERQFYAYNFEGDFPDLKEEYKYYKITTRNIGITDVEEANFTPKEEDNIKLDLDIERMISSYMPPEGYEEITYDSVEFTYTRITKMKSEYLVPALLFRTSKTPTKGENYKPEQVIPLIYENQLK